MVVAIVCFMQYLINRWILKHNLRGKEVDSLRNSCLSSKL